ncbi:MAG: SDR family oxidoreductase [Pseudomonadota bacterium]|nr:SDR family oxidoreductase [Pseudomonadota bacterium]
MTQKKAVITGAGRGLGRALALGLAEAGFLPLLIGRSPADLQQTADLVRQHYNVAAGVCGADLSAPDQIAKACRDILQDHSSIDVLVNNAAGWTEGPLENLTDTQIADQISVTITAGILLAKHLKPVLKKTATGAHVINIVSMGGLPNAALVDGSVAFYASKYGQAGMGDILRQELKVDGISVCNILPTGILGDSTWFDDSASLREKHGPG